MKNEQEEENETRHAFDVSMGKSTMIVYDAINTASMKENWNISKSVSDCKGNASIP